MKRTQRSLLWTAAVLTVGPIFAWLLLVSTGVVKKPGGSLEPPFDLSDRLSSVDIQERDGRQVAVFEDSGMTYEFTGEELLAELAERQRPLNPILRLLDVTSPTGVFWVVFGLLGQAVFMGRMIVQWWASERAKASIVPTAFWWLSLLGASMLMIYFIWRKEIVGFLGQCTGWGIYLRNLWLIYGKPSREAGSK